MAVAVAVAGVVASVHVYNPPLLFFEKDWTAEQFSAGCFAANVGPSAIAVFARQGALLRADILPGRILVAGTETSEAFYGYIEGGARRGEEVALSIEDGKGKDNE